jgi:hypothetical protein
MRSLHGYEAQFWQDLQERAARTQPSNKWRRSATDVLMLITDFHIKRGCDCCLRPYPRVTFFATFDDVKAADQFESVWFHNAMDRSRAEDSPAVDFRLDRSRCNNGGQI